MMGDADAPNLRQYGEMQMSYDRDAGTLDFFDGFIREQIEIRKNLIDAVLRQVVIIELERLGYTVISPDTDTEKEH